MGVQGRILCGFFVSACGKPPKTGHIKGTLLFWYSLKACVGYSMTWNSQVRSVVFASNAHLIAVDQNLLSEGLNGDAAHPRPGARSSGRRI